MVNETRRNEQKRLVNEHKLVEKVDETVINLKQVAIDREKN